MRAITLSLILGGALFCGCSDDHIFQGRGDGGQFILQRVRASGGHIVTTNGLPALATEWQHAHNKSGDAVLFSLSAYTNVETYLHSAFGPSLDSGGRSIWHVGVYVYLDRIGTNTEVDILPHL